MAKKPEKEKKENPLLMGLLALFSGTVFFVISKTHDLELALIFTLPGKIVYPILGVLLYIGSFFLFKEWFALRKARKEKSENKEHIR